MKNCVRDVAEFHEKADTKLPDDPLTNEQRMLALDLVVEEFFELLSGHSGLEGFVAEVKAKFQDQLEQHAERYPFDVRWNEEHDVDVSDAIIDLIVVLVRMGLAYDYPLEALWKEVQRANMDKVRDGVRKRADGKILKPEGWRPPDILGVLRAYKETKRAQRTVIPGKSYKHYKGGLYYVHFVSEHSETGEKLVCYESCNPGETGRRWVRPLEMFLAHIYANGIKVPRFTLVEG